MADRRGFLTGLLAASLVPIPSWADAGNPRYLTAARHLSGEYRLCGLGQGGEMLFALPLPARGHAAAAHPARPEAIAFARRPGRFALVVDCARGAIRAELSAPSGRHFYGHGVFSSDGSRFFTSENDLDTLEGRIGIWESDTYRRIGEIASGGIGPHDLRRLPETDVLVVANGGIETHPDSGRAKLNLPTMRANLAFVTPEGAVLECFEMPSEMRLNSLRHLAIRSDGMVAAAMQWQGALAEAPPLLMLYENGAARFLAPDPILHHRCQGYAGSVAFSEDEGQVAFTSPRGGLLVVFDVSNGQAGEGITTPDICGLAPGPAGFAYSSGQGLVAQSGAAGRRTAHRDYSFDNHLIAL